MHKKALAKKARAKNKRTSSLQTSLEEKKNKSKDQELHEQFGLIIEIQRSQHVVLFDDTHFTLPLKSDLSVTPAVGDHVLLDVWKNPTCITTILSRKSSITRLRKDNSRFTGKTEEHVLAANIDMAVIVTSLAEPEVNPHLIDRYLILCQYGDVQPLICLTKADLTNLRPEILTYYQNQLGIPVVETSSQVGMGMDQLKALLTGKIVVFLGKSGVGKSSLINRLSPRANVKTNTISTKSKEGRHTTTSSHMYTWEDRSYIIDTPGIRALNVDHIPLLDLEQYFPDIYEKKQYCRYSNCTHTKEPYCNIQQAVQEGTLPLSRYNTYLKLRESNL